MSKLDKDQVIEKFTEVYTSAKGKKPSIEAKGGWYSIDGGKNVRLSAVEEMIVELEASGSASEKTEAPKKPKKTANKTTTSNKAKTKSSFSVKTYWQEQIIAQNPGSKLPR